MAENSPANCQKLQTSRNKYNYLAWRVGSSIAHTLAHPCGARRCAPVQNAEGLEVLTTEQHETIKSILPRFILKTSLAARLGILKSKFFEYLYYTKSKRNHELTGINH